jgi:hypothetical protein
MSGEVQDSSIDLYWLPLGASGRSMGWNGRVLEAVIARREHRAVEDLLAGPQRLPSSDIGHG